MKVQLTTEVVMTGYQAMEQLIRLTDAVSMHVWEIYEKYMDYIKYTGPAHEHWEIAKNGYEVVFSGEMIKDKRIPLRVFTDPNWLSQTRVQEPPESEDEENAGFWWTPV